MESIIEETNDVQCIDAVTKIAINSASSLSQRNVSGLMTSQNHCNKIGLIWALSPNSFSEINEMKFKFGNKNVGGWNKRDFYEITDLKDSELVETILC